MELEYSGYITLDLEEPFTCYAELILTVDLYHARVRWNKAIKSRLIRCKSWIAPD